MPCQHAPTLPGLNWKMYSGRSLNLQANRQTTPRVITYKLLLAVGSSSVPGGPKAARTRGGACSLAP